MSDLISRSKLIKYLESRTLEFIDDTGIGWNSGIETAIRVVKKFPSIEQKSEWISVKDRLPDLIQCSAGTAYSDAVCVITEDRIICTAIWNGEYWIGDFDYWEADWKTVTHWKSVLPLPEPPEGEEHG